jgi:hypothetical protein
VVVGRRIAARRRARWIVIVDSASDTARHAQENGNRNDKSHPHGDPRCQTDV